MPSASETIASSGEAGRAGERARAKPEILEPLFEQAHPASLLDAAGTKVPAYCCPLMVRRLLVVLLQQVDAEVAVEIAPHGVDVVAFVLDAVVFDQEGRPLDAVVVQRALLDAAHPGEFHLVEARLLELCDALGRQRLGLSAGVLLDQREQHPALRRGHCLVGQPRVLLDRGLARVGGEDVVGRLFRDDGHRPLLRGERGDERTPEVFLRVQHARALRGPAAHLRRVAPEKLRRGRNRHAVDQRPVQRDVVPLPAHAPRAGRRRLAEQGEVVLLGIPAHRVLLDLGQHQVQRPDRLGLRVSLLAQAGLDQMQRRLLLRRRHLLQRQALAILRDVEPVEPLVAVEGQLHLRALGRRERGKKGRRGAGQLAGRARQRRSMVAPASATRREAAAAAREETPWRAL